MSTNLWGGVIELLAVLIGVLIALWVNNWNEQRKDRRREAAYLGSLRDDVEADREALTRCIGFSDGTASAAASILRLLRGADHAPPPQNVLLRKLKRAGTLHPFRPTNTTLRELSGGGGLTLISDRRLLRAALDYYSAAETVATDFTQMAIHHIWYRYYEALVKAADPILQPQLSLDAFAQMRSGDGMAIPATSEAPLPDIGIPIPEDAARIDSLRGNEELQRALAHVWNASVVYRREHARPEDQGGRPVAEARYCIAVTTAGLPNRELLLSAEASRPPLVTPVVC